MSNISLKNNLLKLHVGNKVTRLNPQLYTSICGSYLNQSLNNSFKKHKQTRLDTKFITKKVINQKQKKNIDNIKDLKNILHSYNSTLNLKIEEQIKHKRCSSIKSLYLSV